MTTDSLNPKQANSSVSALPTRDEAAALEAAGGDEDLSHELLGTLLAGLPAEIADLQRLHATGNWSELGELAHQVRGATRYCGVPALDETMSALQKAAESADRERIDAMITQALHEAQRLQDTTA